MSFDIFCRNCGESFSRNSWGWSLLCDGLIEYGAIGAQIAREDRPRWPDYPGDEHLDEDDNGIDEAGKLYVAARDAVLAWKPEDETLPPWHKFDDNSGWIVTEDECKAMLAAIAGRGRPASAEGLNASTWPEFITFLTHCAGHGGFEVR